MLKKITVSVFIAFFVVLFLACSSGSNKSSTDPNDTYRPNSSSASAWSERDGFFQHSDHLYGFDRHPEPKKDNAEDSIAYISVLQRGIGLAKVRITPKDGADYYICDPNDKSYRIAEIDNKLKEQAYTIDSENMTFEDGIKTVALCMNNETGPRIVQKLQIHSYDWKEYDFDAYVLGNGIDDDRYPHRDGFWVRFDSIFSQAVVRHGEWSIRFKIFDKGYIFTRTEGRYGYDECAKGDIGEIMDTIFQNAAHYEYNREYIYREYGLKKRAVIQINYPTKRFWQLTDVNGKIEICGKPDSIAPNSGLVLESLSSPNCPAITEKIDVFNSNGIWKLRYKNGREEIANTSNTNPECRVFAETSIGDYVGEIGDFALAVMKPLTYSGMGISMGVNMALLPWSEKYKKTAMQTAFHELGHTMGLKDLNDKPLSCVPNKQAKPDITTGEIEICVDGTENNLMHYTANSKEHKLRNRNIKGAYDKDMSVNKQESQWKCLQRTNEKKNCMNQEVYLAD